MEEKYLNKYVKVTEKDGTITYGVIEYWVEEMGEIPFIVIGNRSIDIKDIKEIEELTE